MMTQVANEVGGFKSEVLTNGGSIQRVQDREAIKERERLEKEAYEKHAAQSAARRNQAREERAIALAQRVKAKQEADEEKGRQAAAQKLLKEQEALSLQAKKEAQQSAQKAERQSQASGLLDELSKSKNEKQSLGSSSGSSSSSSSTLLQIADDIDESEDFEGLEVEPIFTPVKGEVHVPAYIAVENSRVEPKAHDLGELLPAPVALTMDTLTEPVIQTETAKELINRISTPANGDIKSKRGHERIQKIIHEKRDLEKQVEDLQVTVVSLQETIRKFEIESKLVDNVMTLSNAKKKPSELVSEAKQQILNFLNTRSDEIDHIDKAICFNKYMSDPFYMQVFVQNNQPEQWHTMIESIYEAIERPQPSLTKVKPAAVQSLAPIRSRTATLGAPLASAGNPMDRIAQHLGNMGI